MEVTLPPECEEIYAHCSKNIMEPPPGSQGVSLSEEEVFKVLPQKGQMCLVDRVGYLDLKNNYIQAHCDLAKRDEIFKGHYPDYPIWPGVLQIESMGQAGQILWTLQNTLSFDVVQITNIYNTRFLKPITPPGIVDIRARSFDNGLFVVSVAQSIFNGQVCSVTIIKAIA